MGRDSVTISGLVVYLSNDAQIAREASAAIEADPRFTIGECQQDRLPVVQEVPAGGEREAWRWLEQQPGVRMVTLAYSHFDPSPEEDDATAEA